MEDIALELLTYGGITAGFILSRQYLHGRAHTHEFYELLFAILITGFGYIDARIVADAFDENEYDVRWMRTLTYTPYVFYSYMFHNFLYEPVRTGAVISTIGMLTLQIAGCAPLLRTAYVVATYGHFYIVSAFLTYVRAEWQQGCLGPTLYKKYISMLNMGVILPIVLGVYGYMGYMMYKNDYLFDYMGMDWGIAYMVCHSLYVYFDTYVSAVDYGYNRALDRISREEELV